MIRRVVRLMRRYHPSRFNDMKKGLSLQFSIITAIILILLPMGASAAPERTRQAVLENRTQTIGDDRLAAAKRNVTRAIDLWIAQADAVATYIGSSGLEEPVAVDLKSQIANLKTKLEIYKKRVTAASSISAVRNISTMLRQLRQRKTLLTIRRVISLSKLSAYHSGVMQKAQARLQAMENKIRTLQSSGKDIGPIGADFEKAKAEINEARMSLQGLLVTLERSNLNEREMTETKEGFSAIREQLLDAYAIFARIAASKQFRR